MPLGLPIRRSKWRANMSPMSLALHDWILPEKGPMHLPTFTEFVQLQTFLMGVPNLSLQSRIFCS